MARRQLLMPLPPLPSSSCHGPSLPAPPQRCTAYLLPLPSRPSPSRHGVARSSWRGGVVAPYLPFLSCPSSDASVIFAVCAPDDDAFYFSVDMYSRGVFLEFKARAAVNFLPGEDLWLQGCMTDAYSSCARVTSCMLLAKTAFNRHHQELTEWHFSTLWRSSV
ncbi:hypothetical protein U9M48_007939 [Paspalum notatum var. saurae]|uniref:Uncharacterized protein n=1 Tax=Paspalum notatum var. saurae TaxID=547442 RepID=A0AAQ3SN07_PASNO